MELEAWHFVVWKQFNRKVFKRTITQSDQQGKKFFLPKVSVIRQGGNPIERPVNEKAYRYEKDGQGYVIIEDYAQHLPISPTTWTECYLKESDKTIFRLVEDFAEARLLPEKTMSFREFIDGWNPVLHTDRKTQLFLNMLLVASRYKPVKIGLCTEPEGGKNMNFTIGGYITNDIVKLAMPITLAKLEETLFFNRVLIGNEITSMTSAQVREVERVFLDLADESPDMQKHSIARKKLMGVMHTEKTSIVFPFNRRQDLSQGATFFDDLWQNKAAIKSRYPVFLLEGKVTTTMGKMNSQKAEEVMERNYDEMRVWAKNLIYFMENLHKEFNITRDGVKAPMVSGARQMINMEGILDCLAAYCTTNEEYNEWTDWLNGRIRAYREMANVQELSLQKYAEETV